MRYRLRTLLIVLALGPPLLAAVWFWGDYVISLAYLSLPHQLMPLRRFKFITGLIAVAFLTVAIFKPHSVLEPRDSNQRSHRRCHRLRPQLLAIASGGHVSRSFAAAAWIVGVLFFAYYLYYLGLLVRPSLFDPG